MVKGKIKKKIEIIERPKANVLVDRDIQIMEKDIGLTTNLLSEKLHLSCPNCHAVDEFIKIDEQENEYKCLRCGKGWVGFPPPSK